MYFKSISTILLNFLPIADFAPEHEIGDAGHAPSQKTKKCVRVPLPLSHITQLTRVTTPPTKTFSKLKLKRFKKKKKVALLYNWVSCSYSHRFHLSNLLLQHLGLGLFLLRPLYPWWCFSIKSVFDTTPFLLYLICLFHRSGTKSIVENIAHLISKEFRGHIYLSRTLPRSINAGIQGAQQPMMNQRR